MKNIKKLLLILLFALPIYAQSNGTVLGKGAIWTDSLYYGVPGDSVRIFDVNFVYDWVTITTEGNSNSPVDSIKVTPGYIQYSENAQTSVDTIWGSVALFRDNSWTAVNRAVNTSAGASYLMINPIPQLLKVELVNTRAVLTTRKLTYQLIGSFR